MCVGERRGKALWERERKREKGRASSVYGL